MLERLTRTNLPPLLSEVSMSTDHPIIGEFPISRRWTFCGVKDGKALFSIRDEHFTVALDGKTWWWND